MCPFFQRNGTFTINNASPDVIDLYREFCVLVQDEASLAHTLSEKVLKGTNTLEKAPLHPNIFITAASIGSVSIMKQLLAAKSTDEDRMLLIQVAARCHHWELVVESLKHNSSPNDHGPLFDLSLFDVLQHVACFARNPLFASQILTHLGVVPSSAVMTELWISTIAHDTDHGELLDWLNDYYSEHLLSSESIIRQFLEKMLRYVPGSTYFRIKMHDIFWQRLASIVSVANVIFLIIFFFLVRRKLWYKSGNNTCRRQTGNCFPNCGDLPRTNRNGWYF